MEEQCILGKGPCGVCSEQVRFFCHILNAARVAKRARGRCSCSVQQTEPIVSESGSRSQRSRDQQTLSGVSLFTKRLTFRGEHPADPESLLLFKNPVTDTVRAGTEDVPSVF